MAPTLIFNSLSSIFLFFLLTPSSFSHAHSPHAPSPHAHSPQSNDQIPSPLHFLKNLIGTQKGHEASGFLELKKYLSNLGYMSGNDNNLELALKMYQKYFYLEQNGILDNETIHNLLKPRCGVPDSVVQHDVSQLPRNNPWMVSHYTFLPTHPKWPPTKNTLTYSFLPGTRSDVMQPIVRATAQWASVSRFKFNYVEDYDKADIKISFQHGDHGDGSPFDGPGGVIAHSFGPPDGRLHYDAEEMWVDGVAPGYVDLQTTGLHELGHCLGLGHSTNPDSVMYAIIPPNTRKGLAQDDIDGITALYQNQ